MQKAIYAIFSILTGIAAADRKHTHDLTLFDDLISCLQDLGTAVLLPMLALEGRKHGSVKHKGLSIIAAVRRGRIRAVPNDCAFTYFSQELFDLSGLGCAPV